MDNSCLMKRLKNFKTVILDIVLGNRTSIHFEKASDKIWICTNDL